MNWVQYKDLLSYNCLCGTVVESLSLTQEILGSTTAIFLFDFKHLVKTPLFQLIAAWWKVEFHANVFHLGYIGIKMISVDFRVKHSRI